MITRDEHRPRIRRSHSVEDRRDHYIDCGLRTDERLAMVVDEIRSIRPTVILAYASAIADLARYINRTGTRSWDTIPVICGAERLWPQDRAAMIDELLALRRLHAKQRELHRSSLVA